MQLSCFFGPNREQTNTLLKLSLTVANMNQARQRCSIIAVGFLNAITIHVPNNPNLITGI